MKRCKFSSGVYTNIVVLSFRLKKWDQKILVQNKPQKSSRNLIVSDYSIISGLHQFSSESKMEQSVTILNCPTQLQLGFSGGENLASFKLQDGVTRQTLKNM